MIDKSLRRRIMKCLDSGMSAEAVMNKFGVEAMNDVLKHIEQSLRSKAGRIKKQSDEKLLELFDSAFPKRPTKI